MIFGNQPSARIHRVNMDRARAVVGLLEDSDVSHINAALVRWMARRHLIVPTGRKHRTYVLTAKGTNWAHAFLERLASEADRLTIAQEQEVDRMVERQAREESDTAGELIEDRSAA